MLQINWSKEIVLPKIQKTLKKHEIEATYFILTKKKVATNLKINEGFSALKI